MRKLLVVALLLIWFCGVELLAQSTSASITGYVTDPSKAVITDAKVIVINVDTSARYESTTNKVGSYDVPNLPPGRYRIEVEKAGFKTVVQSDLILHVQDTAAINFELAVGSASEIITVESHGQVVNTTDATVSTVVDRNFAENMPMNGRSFQTLIELTPGVVGVVGGGGNGEDSGEFSVNGQRAASNYWTVDGVSANASSSTQLVGNQMGGATGILSVLGGTNSLVPIDDMQEFRIQTSTFSPEFGRTPGAQIAIATRSGNDIFHGSAFDYLRNDVLDASNWFNGYNNPKPLPKAEERQNDFGGTLGGPILKNRTFFFFSYEGLRLRLPTTTLTTVPDAAARTSAVPAIRPLLDAFPLDPNQPDLGNGVAQFNASYSNPATLNDYNFRIDHRLNDKLQVFARYNYSPSQLSTRGLGSNSLSSVGKSETVTQQLTAGTTWTISPRIVDEFRFNYSRTDSSGSNFLDSFGGAVPWAPTPPSPFTSGNAAFEGFILSLSHGLVNFGPLARNVQYQTNFVDTGTFQLGAHNFKAGVDYRRLTPVSADFPYAQDGLFLSVGQAETGNSLFTMLEARNRSQLLLQNLGVFVQDAWRFSPSLTLTYGLRWDTDFAPQSISGPPVSALANFDPNNLSAVTLAPAGTPPFRTEFTNVAPRVGLAYQISQRPNWDRVVRGGFGVFYDLATSEMGNIIAVSGYPYFSLARINGSPFPLTGGAAAPPAILPPTPNAPGLASGFDPNLKLPYALQWNLAMEQQLGAPQSLTLAYVGAVGRRLLQSENASGVNPAFTQLISVSNSATSDYHALQVTFRRRLEKNLQVLAAYTWAHSIDSASAGSGAVLSNIGTGTASGNRASSDFDIRHALTLGTTYQLPVLTSRRFVRPLMEGWSWQNRIQAQTAPPMNVNEGNISAVLSNGFETQIRPDVVPGIPLYLYGSKYPGGKAINNTPGAATCQDGTPSIGPFCAPPVANFAPVRQGTLTRNALRAFGSFQWDMGIHRDFPIREPLRMEFRAELFNVLNHPNFGPPQGSIGRANFGLSTQTLNQYLGGGFGSSGLNSLYQLGGPRSVQLALKLFF